MARTKWTRSKKVKTPPETTTTTNAKRRKLTKKVVVEEEEEDEAPLVGVFCLKKRQDMKVFEEKEDCFILDFDPNDDSFDSEKKKLSSSENPESDDDVEIIHEKGQVACRDFPHPRHLCLKYPFGSTNHKLHCDKCYCYVCDVAAPCARWTHVYYESHCEAMEATRWKQLRRLHQQR